MRDVVMNVSKLIAFQVDTLQKTSAGMVTLVNAGVGAGVPINKEA
jgi:hypothetical protein